MASMKLTSCALLCIWLFIGVASAQLTTNFYATSCPNVLPTIRTAIDTAVRSGQRRMGASLLRLHFHDCFVNASLISFNSGFFFFIFILLLVRLFLFRSQINGHSFSNCFKLRVTLTSVGFITISTLC